MQKVKPFRLSVKTDYCLAGFPRLHVVWSVRLFIIATVILGKLTYAQWITHWRTKRSTQWSTQWGTYWITGIDSLEQREWQTLFLAWLHFMFQSVTQETWTEWCQRGSGWNEAFSCSCYVLLLRVKKQSVMFKSVLNNFIKMKMACWKLVKCAIVSFYFLQKNHIYITPNLLFTLSIYQAFEQYRS